MAQKFAFLIKRSYHTYSLLGAPSSTSTAILLCAGVFTTLIDSPKPHMVKVIT